MNFEKWVVKLFSIFNRNENDLTLSFFIFQVLTKINWHSGTRIVHALYTHSRGHRCVFIHICVTRFRSSRNIEALASKVKHKLNILKTRDSKKYGGCELTIVARNEFGKTVLYVCYCVWSPGSDVVRYQYTPKLIILPF